MFFGFATLYLAVPPVPFVCFYSPRGKCLLVVIMPGELGGRCASDFLAFVQAVFVTLAIGV